MPLLLVPIALAGARLATDPNVRELAREFWLPPGAELPPESAPLAPAHATSSPSSPGTLVPISIPDPYYQAEPERRGLFGRFRRREDVGRLELLRKGTGGTVSPCVPNLSNPEAAFLLRSLPGRASTKPGAFPGTTTVQFHRLDLNTASHVLGLVQQLDREQLRAGAMPISAALHDGRLEYTSWDPDEEWRTIRDVWRFGEGDCDDLAPAVAAELEAAGIAARAILMRSGPGTLHALVHRRDTGQILDPSITGGMRAP